ncbi:MAG: hypothetical protein HZB46_14340 [Solirubrobacterales bacterium]|nr:hypothetical protein [Solirubrobacterales bacterium]
MIHRLRRAFTNLRPEQRLAAATAAALFFTMFLPWYSTSGIEKGKSVSNTLTAFGAFSFVEAAVLLVAVGVLVLLFHRAEGRSFHLPGGDGVVIMAGGAWAALLTFYRTLDKPDPPANQIVGVEWGIFVAILAGLALAYAGNRLRAAHLVEPPLPGEEPTRRVPRPGPPGPPGPPRDPRSPRVSRGPLPDPHAAETEVAPPGGRQLSFDDQD